MHLHNCMCFQERLRLLMQSLRVLHKAPGRPGRICKEMEAQMTATGVFRMYACGFLTDLYSVNAD